MVIACCAIITGAFAFRLLDKGKHTIVTIRMRTGLKYNVLYLGFIKNKIKCRHFLSKINNKTLTV